MLLDFSLYGSHTVGKMYWRNKWQNKNMFLLVLKPERQG